MDISTLTAEDVARLCDADAAAVRAGQFGGDTARRRVVVANISESAWGDPGESVFGVAASLADWDATR